jgi:regulator of replication initiation timing
LNPHTHQFNRTISLSLVFPLFFAATCAFAQQPQTDTPSSGNASLADSVQELRQQVEELRAAVADMKSETEQYRRQNDELRKQLEDLRAGAQKSGSAAVAAQFGPSPESGASQQLSGLQETTQIIESQVRTQYQTKVESASKYRVRLSGLVLLNLFSNRGATDNLDFPTYAAPSNLYGANSTFGATLRQSELGLEVFGPQLAGAKTSGQVQLDFGGGFPTGALDGVNTGLVRLRTASARLDWQHTSIIAGQDSLFLSPNSPTSFASLVIPSLGYSGNLWAWTPQIRVEHRFDLPDDESITLAGGILDNVTGDPSFGTHRPPQAGESSGQPAYGLHASWSRNVGGHPLSFGASGYYSRQNWGFDWNVDGWAGLADWTIPVGQRLEISGELYRGRAMGGIGGGIGQSVIFSGNPQVPGTSFLPLDAVGGWSQLKLIATPRLEFNGAFGLDNPFGSDIRAFPAPVDYYPAVLAANRSSMFNFIYRPRSNLLVSGEYRHLHTTEIGSYNTAGQVNLVMGVLF